MYIGLWTQDRAQKPNTAADMLQMLSSDGAVGMRLSPRCVALPSLPLRLRKKRLLMSY